MKRTQELLFSSVKAWRNERTVAFGVTRSKVLYDDYCAWIQRTRYLDWLPFHATFGHTMRELGADCYYVNGRPRYRGIALRDTS